MRTVAAEALLLALYTLGAGLIALAALDRVAFAIAVEDLVNHPWCVRPYDWNPSLLHGGWDPSLRALFTLSCAGTVLGAAGFALARVRRSALSLLVVVALTAGLMLLFPLLEWLGWSWAVPVHVDPETGERWFRALHHSREAQLVLAEMTAWTLPPVIIALGCAAARYAVLRGTPRARARLSAAALIAPIVGACALTAVWLGTARSDDHVHWSGPELRGSALALLIAGALAIAVAAAFGLRSGRTRARPGFGWGLVPGLVVVAIGAALYGSAAPLSPMHGGASTSPPQHSVAGLHRDDWFESRPWTLTRASAPCIPLDTSFPDTWGVRVYEGGGAGLRYDYAERDLTADAVKELLARGPWSARNRPHVLLVDRDAPVAVLAPIFTGLADHGVDRVHVAGLVVERVPWLHGELVTWNSCVFGHLGTDAIRAGDSDSDRTWGELVAREVLR